MSNLYRLEQKIFEVDGVRVDLRGSQTALPDYWTNRFKADGRVSEFKTRFSNRYPGIEITVFDGIGRVAGGNYHLKNLRATYEHEWVQEVHQSVIDSFEEILMDQQQVIKDLKKALRKLSKQAVVEEETPDPYGVLNVSRDSSDADIKLAYQRRIKVFHPDKFSGMDPLVIEMVNEKSQQINVARDEIALQRSGAAASTS